MPNIKVKAFALPSVLCYSCGREIKQGDLNWTFNPHKSAMFKHRMLDSRKERYVFQMASASE
jgi:hypothetical protein